MNKKVLFKILSFLPILIIGGVLIILKKYLFAGLLLGYFVFFLILDVFFEKRKQKEYEFFKQLLINKDFKKALLIDVYKENETIVATYKIFNDNYIFYLIDYYGFDIELYTKMLPFVDKIEIQTIIDFDHSMYYIVNSVGLAKSIGYNKEIKLIKQRKRKEKVK